MTLVLLILYFMKSGIQHPVMESVSDCSRVWSLGDLTGERVLMLVVSKRYRRVLNYTELVIYEDTEKEILSFVKSAADKIHTELVSDSSSVQSFIEFRAWKILV